jgi:hypothetical protein
LISSEWFSISLSSFRENPARPNPRAPQSYVVQTCGSAVPFFCGVHLIRELCLYTYSCSILSGMDLKLPFSTTCCFVCALCMSSAAWRVLVARACSLGKYLWHLSWWLAYPIDKTMMHLGQVRAWAGGWVYSPETPPPLVLAGKWGIELPNV